MSASLYSWGLYQALPQTPQPCHWRSDIRSALTEMQAGHGSLLPLGNGRS